MNASSKHMRTIPLKRVEIPPTPTAPEILSLITPFNPELYCKMLLGRYPQASKLMQLCGIHPNQAAPLFNPYTQTIEHTDFTNIGEHSVAVAVLAHSICAALLERAAISQAQAERCVERALLHDIGKPFEIFRRNARGSGSPLDGTSIVGELNAHGLDPQICEALAQYGGETGGETIGQFLDLRSNDELHITSDKLCEKIVRLCDDMTASTVPAANAPAVTVFVDFVKRAVVSDFARRYPIFFKAGIALDEQSNFCWISDLNALGGRSELRIVGDLLSVEQFFCEQVSAEIAQMMGLDSGLEAQRILLQRVWEPSAIIGGDLRSCGGLLRPAGSQ